MDLTLPESPGWSGMHLVNDDWGNIAVIVKREWVIAGGNTTPASDPKGVVVTDEVSTQVIDGDDTMVIEREAETALFKTRADVLFLGIGTTQAPLIDSAELRLNGATRRRFTRSGDGDPINLFGYEPRPLRVPGYKPETFDYRTQGANLFWSARRSNGFSVPSSALNLAGPQSVEVTTTTDGTETVEKAFDVDLPGITATPFVWEGGSNKPAYWCKRPALALLADTLTVDGDMVSVVWRGALPLASYPAADLRRIDIKEAA